MKNRIVLRIATCLLAAGLLVAPLAGCTNTTNANGSATASGSTQTQTGSSEQQKKIKVNVSIQSDATSTDPGKTVSLSIPQDATAYDALRASGADVSASDSSYGIFVESIDGTAGGSNSGWVYSVNGEQPNVGADAYKLKDGDTVAWNFVTF